MASARDRLVRLLRQAYSGEKAAAYAYRGHASSVRAAARRERIRAIEAEEWHHRELVGGMLRALGATPGRFLELRAAVIGRILALGCHLTGELVPLLGAGKLESGNVREYEEAARLARACGREEWVDCLLTMAEVEWEHEAWFRARVLEHPRGRRMRLWPAPPPKSAIRAQPRAPRPPAAQRSVAAPAPAEAE